MTASNRFFYDYEKLRDSNLLFESMLIYCDRSTYESCISFLVFRLRFDKFCKSVRRRFIKGTNKWHEGRSYEVEFYSEDELKYDPFRHIKEGLDVEDLYSLEAVLTNSHLGIEDKIIRNILDRYVNQQER